MRIISWTVTHCSHDNIFYELRLSQTQNHCILIQSKYYCISPSLVQYSDHNRRIRRSFSQHLHSRIPCARYKQSNQIHIFYDYFPNILSFSETWRYDHLIYVKKTHIKARITIFEESLKRSLVFFCWFASCSLSRRIKGKSLNYHTKSLRVFVILYEN